MARCERGDIVRVPFPYTDRSTRQHRPALVVSDGPIGDDAALLWVVMITSAENRPWKDDVTIVDWQGARLPAASVVRPVKIATIEAGQAEAIGRLPSGHWPQVAATLRAILGQA